MSNHEFDEAFDDFGDNTGDGKTVHILFAEGDRPREYVGVMPGDTAAAVLAKIGMNADDYVLSSGGTQTSFGRDEDVYAAVNDGAKLYVAARADAGVVHDA